MDEDFDFNKFRKLMERLYLFQEYIHGEEPADGAEVRDNFDNSDLTSLMQLPIFPHLKNINEWGENVKNIAIKEIKSGDKTTGARAIIQSCQDWCDHDTPIYFYEAVHVPGPNGAENYVKEIHLDDLIVQVAGNPSEILPAGSENGRNLVQRIIGQSAGKTMPEKLTKSLRARCLVQQPNIEVWKVGIPDKAYHLMGVGDRFTAGINLQFLIEDYLNQEKVIFPKEDPLSDKSLAEIRLVDYGGDWYSRGKFSFIYSQSEKDSARKRLNATKQLIERFKGITPEIEAGKESLDSEVYLRMKGQNENMIVQLEREAEKCREIEGGEVKW